MDTEEQLYWLCLARLPGLKSSQLRRVLPRFPELEKALNAPLSAWSESATQDLIATLELWRAGVSSHAVWQQARRDQDRLADCGARIHVLGQADYPLLLAQIHDPPPILYSRGCREAFSLPQFAMVGSRRASAQALRLASQFAGGMAEHGFSICSGMALGVDGAAHRGALEAGGRTVAVMATGIDVCYPRQHRSLATAIVEQGLLVTEFAPGAAPRRQHFPRRNRLISGLSLGTIVIEAPERSGALITARYALEHNREVFAVPGQIFDRQSVGCHRLIKDGAKLVERVEDVLEELGQWQLSVAGQEHAPKITEDKEANPPSAEEHQVLRCLQGKTRDVDGLSALCNLEPAALLEVLLRLELAGLVEALPGRRFALAS